MTTERYIVKESGASGFYLFDTVENKPVEATLSMPYGGYLEAKQDAKFLNEETK